MWSRLDRQLGSGTLGGEDITDLELEEIRQLKHPPATVRRVMELASASSAET
jgi:hypothetical protein